MKVKPAFPWVQAYTGVRDVLTSYRVAYWREGRGFPSEHHEATYDRLRSLPADAPREAVEVALESKGWRRAGPAAIAARMPPGWP